MMNNEKLFKATTNKSMALLNASKPLNLVLYYLD